MHVRILFLPIVALLFNLAGFTVAKGAKYVTECTEQADQLCPSVDHSLEPWKQWFRACMQLAWIDSVTNNTCPYADINCRCYNGCVGASWRYQKDVGGYCHAQCKTSDAVLSC
ncbi:hypothetical protein V8E36_002111 [Tilletia maclaganii]